MLFSRDKDDDDDFTPNPNYHSNLASLFGNSGGEGNSSLTYTPPKQPKKQSKATPISAPTSAVSNPTSVIAAKTVQAFKMVDGAYQNQGKVGAAVISLTTDDCIVYQLLLYLDKRHHLCSARITRDFNFHVQAKNYCSFYDKQNFIWSILFDSALEVADFTLQIAIARWKAGDPTSPIMIQDLWCPVSEKAVAAVEQDSVQLNYTLHPITSTGQELEESLSVWVDVENSGWKQALMGVKPTSKRVIIVQPYMLGDLNPKEVMYNSPVMVKLTVVEVSKPCKPSSLPEIPTDDNTDLPKPLSKSHSAMQVPSEAAPKSPKFTKADLITRMARMGQALPFKTAALPSDSEETEEDQSHLHSTDRPVPKIRARVQHSATLPPATLPTVVGGNPPVMPPIPIAQQQMSDHAQWASAPFMVLQSPMESQFNMFFSEVRTTNSELRMGLTRLTDKVEALQNKIEETNRRPDSETPSAIERLLENEQQLKNQLELVLSALNNSQSRHSTEPPVLPAISAKPCLRCIDLDQAHSSLLERVKKLEEENEYLQTSLSAQKDALQNAKIADTDQMAQIGSLQKQLEEERSRASALNERLQHIQTDRERSAQDLELMNKSVKELQNTLQEKQTNIDKLEQALRENEATQIEEVRRNLREVFDLKPLLKEHIKNILNSVYRLLRDQFKPQQKYEADFIQVVLGETIKGVTLQYLENGNMLSQMQPQTLSRAQGGKTNISAVGQTQSAPVMRSEGSSGQFMRMDQRTEVDADTKLSQDNFVEVASDIAPSTPQISAATRCADPTNTQIIKEDISVDEENSPNTKQEKPVFIEKDTTPQADPNLFIHGSVSNSSEEVVRSQPPPLPFFDEEENSDDWLN